MVTYDYDDGRAIRARMSLGEWLALPIDSRRGTIAKGTTAMVLFVPPGVAQRIPVEISPAAAPTLRKRPEPANR